MKKLSMKDLKTLSGVNAIIYGETGVGKTVSTLISCPKPALYIMCEKRDIGHVFEVVPEEEINQIEVAIPEKFKETYDLLLSLNQENSPYKTIIIDSLTYLANVMLLTELEEETKRAGVFNTAKRPLTYEVKTDISGYGAIVSWMTRICNLMMEISKKGKLVVGICLLAENPKWDRELAGAPSFATQKFHEVYPAFFDLIGIVIKRQDKKYPPVVIFDDRILIEKGQGACLTKWSGEPNSQKWFPLNWKEILKELKKDWLIGG